MKKRTMGLLISHKNNEMRRAILPEDVKLLRNPDMLYFETGYGDSVGHPDQEYLDAGAHVVSREDALPLEEGQYYLADLMDMQVTDEEGAVLGTLTDVIETGANDVYVVSREGKKDLLIPNIPACIREVDIENGRMKVHLLPGLEDL